MNNSGSFTRVMNQAKRAYDRLQNAERRLEEDHRKKSSAASKQYEKTLIGLADEVSVIAEKVKVAVPREEGTAIQEFLRLIIVGIDDRLGYLMRKLRNGYTSEDDFTNLFFFEQVFSAEEFEKIRRQFASWSEDHPDNTIEEYLARCIREELGEKQVSVESQVDLLRPGPFYYYHADEKVVSWVTAYVTVTFR